MEAKMARYESATGPSIGVRSAKVISTELSSSDSEKSSVIRADFRVCCALLSIVAIVWTLGAEYRPVRYSPVAVRSVPILCTFAPQVSFRPPPVL